MMTTGTLTGNVVAFTINMRFEISGFMYDGVPEY